MIKLWWKEDITEELAIVSALTIAVISLFLLGESASQLVSNIASGFIGYMSGRK